MINLQESMGPGQDQLVTLDLQSDLLPMRTAQFSVTLPQSPPQSQFVWPVNIMTINYHFYNFDYFLKGRPWLAKIQEGCSISETDYIKVSAMAKWPTFTPGKFRH